MLWFPNEHRKPLNCLQHTIEMNNELLFIKRLIWHNQIFAAVVEVINKRPHFFLFWQPQRFNINITTKPII